MKQKQHRTLTYKGVTEMFQAKSDERTQEIQGDETKKQTAFPAKKGKHAMRVKRT